MTESLSHLRIHLRDVTGTSDVTLLGRLQCLGRGLVLGEEIGEDEERDVTVGPVARVCREGGDVGLGHAGLSQLVVESVGQL